MARGGVSAARIAMYKVCSLGGCIDADILAAFDDAIVDGVDIISISIGGPIVTDELSGEGVSINTHSLGENMYPLTSGTFAAGSPDPYLNATMCDIESLGPAKVKGKIVLCQEYGLASDSYIEEIGGRGVIFSVDSSVYDDTAFTTVRPVTFVDPSIGQQIMNYIDTSGNDAAGLLYRTITEPTKAPVIAEFSSRGPQFTASNILKPDIAAAGVDILAGYTRLNTITGADGDERFADFNIMSGTSMSTPHVAAAAAYVMSFHPHWSEASIRSALMTSATPIIMDGVEFPFNSGSGLLNPTGAVHPGLLYDMTLSSYIQYLCKEGINITTLLLSSGDKPNPKCSDFPPARGTDGLNYPSMHLQIHNRQTTYSATFHRIVTHVGNGTSTFEVTVESPDGM